MDQINRFSLSSVDLSARPLHIHGQKMTDTQMLFLQLDLWSRSVSTEVFNTILDDVASALADWKDNTTDQVDSVLAGFHDFASQKREGFGDFQRSRQYSRLWNSVDQAAKNVDQAAKNRTHNQAKRENAERKVSERWGYKGTAFMRLNPAIQWGVKVRKLSELVGDYDTAMSYINRAIYTKRINSTDAYRNEFSLAPGGADIVRARVLAERGQGAHTLSEEELAAGEPRYSLHIGENGLLSYGRRPDVTEVSIDVLIIYQN